MSTSSADTLKSHGLRVTPVREQVLQLILQSGTTALSSAYIEQALHPLDRITLYRTLRVFEQKGIVHQVTGQKGTIKYASCTSGCGEHTHHDDHVHFHCTDCDTTVCLPDTTIPAFSVPRGFKAEDQHVLLSGLCDDCQN